MNTSTVLAAAQATVNNPANPAQSNAQICAALQIVLPFLGTLNVTPGMSTFKKMALRAAVPILQEVVGMLCRGR